MRNLLLIFSLFILASCSSDVRSNLGLVKNSPNEFSVIASPPLSIPPNFEVYPPEYYANSVKNNFASEKKEYKSGSGLEKKMLSNMKDYESSSEIRKILTEEEQKREEHKRKSLLGKIF